MFYKCTSTLYSLTRTCETLRSDKDTNFVGVVDYLGLNAINVEDKKVQSTLRTTELPSYLMPLMHRIYEEFGNELLEVPARS